MIEEKIKELGFEVPQTPKPLAAYTPAVQVGDMVYTSGQVPIKEGELKYAGKIGADLTVEEGQKAAEICALNGLSAIKSVINDLEKIEQIIKVTVFVNSATGFTDQPKVANGASEMLTKIFGEAGRHVRSAVGVNELPIDSAVEIEMIVKVK
ncbi:MAG: RidA family protein [Ignavibacteriaceae bacterium]|jgi:enamine deaminase RidA (YjgF/YER057c/UK114 family)